MAEAFVDAKMERADISASLSTESRQNWVGLHWSNRSVSGPGKPLR